MSVKTSSPVKIPRRRNKRVIKASEIQALSHDTDLCPMSVSLVSETKSDWWNDIYHNHPPKTQSGFLSRKLQQNQMRSEKRKITRQDLYKAAEIVDETGNVSLIITYQIMLKFLDANNVIDERIFKVLVHADFVNDLGVSQNYVNDVEQIRREPEVYFDLILGLI